MSTRFPPLRVLSVGRDAVLVELEDGATALAMYDALEAARTAGTDRDPALTRIVELVPAARTVLVRVQPGPRAAEDVVAAIGRLAVRVGERPPGAVVRVPVVYDGDDLDEVAAMTSMSVEEVVDRHTAPTYDVAFTGFAPGFAYLSGGDPRLEVPRRTTPRTAIPAGAVGLAGPFSGVYPRRSPGGWQLLGRTPTPMWDLDRTPPALLLPGMRVRFVAVSPGEAAVELAPRHTTTPADRGGIRAGSDGQSWLEVLAPGLLSVVEDLGRPGRSALGVTGSGAADRPALRRANRLLGNAVDAAAVEHVGGGLALLAHGTVVVAVTGASGPIVIEGTGTGADEGEGGGEGGGGVRDVLRDRPLLLADGEVLVVGAPDTGTTAYVGVLGGVDVPPVLGSRATDLLSGLGPEPLGAGSVLPVGTATAGSVSDAPEAGPRLPSGPGQGPLAAVTVDVTLGPRDEWFTDAARAAFGATAWTVTPRSNRVGARLAGPPLERAVDHELPSEATVAGAVQVPADGQPVVFLADHPVTGGYPVIAVVVPEHLGLVAQTPPGARIRFRVVAP